MAFSPHERQSPPYKHPTKAGLVTLPGKPGDELAPGTLNSIFKQAGLKKE
jgi:predicted RNA binding protein YcfA (HicA-like mRNA interferase family)